MEYEQIKERLDKLVANMKEREDLSNFSPSIEINCSDNYILFTKGIEIVANEMSLELKERYLTEEQIPNITHRYEYSFVYNGVEFCQLCKERIGSR